jgi:glycosyltransferase involved in cell wall biosynthesis
VTRRRILALAPYPPRLDGDHGGSRALAELLGALAERHDVVLLAARAPGELPIDPAVASWCLRAAETPRAAPAPGSSQTLPRLVRHARIAAGLARGVPSLVTRWRMPRGKADAADLLRGWTPDIVQVHGEVMAGLATAVAPKDVPLVLVTFEPAVRAAADAPHDRLAALELRAWRRHTALVLDRMAAVVTLTEADRAALAEFGGAALRETIPLGLARRLPSGAPGPKPDDESPLLLFVGNFMHPPNRVAAMRLVRTIHPALRREFPALRLRIVGDSPTDELRDAAGAGVEITGRVPDVRPHLASATVVVAPLATGGGMRVKVLEALAAGAAVVATPRAVEGIGVTDGAELLVADDDVAFAGAVASLLNDPARRQALGAAAQQWVERHGGWGDAMAAYDALYARLLGGAAR